MSIQSDTKTGYVSAKLMGGLGNRLFQMACAYGYAKKYHLICYISTSQLVNNLHSTQHYENTLFSQFKKYSLPDEFVYREPEHLAMSYIENIPSPPSSSSSIKSTVLIGYFQHENYISMYKNEFIAMLQFPKRDIIKNTCFIHVRRGDYITKPLHNVDLQIYYKNALQYVRSCKPFTKFLVFSDDIEWCKQQDIFESFEFYEERDEVMNMVSMSMCENGGICANSSFSWWGSYLNSNANKIVTFPNVWFNDPSYICDIGYKGSIILPVSHLIKPLRVKVFSAICSIEEAVRNYKNVCDLFANPYPYIELVDDEDYTHAFFVNNPKPDLSIPKENVIGSTFEPYIFEYPQLARPDYIQYLRKHVGMYLIGQHNNLPEDVFTSHYTYQWHKWQRGNIHKKYDKKYKMSFVLSNTILTPGHKYRHTLVDRLLQTNMDIHIWGRGAHLHGSPSDVRIKGPHNDEEPYENYEYTIAIENSQENYYVTEKYTDAIGYHCKVLYLGAPKIQEIFGIDCCIKLTGNLETDVKIIEDAYYDRGPYVNLEHAMYELFYGKAYLPAFLRDSFIKDIHYKK